MEILRYQRTVWCKYRNLYIRITFLKLWCDKNSICASPSGIVAAIVGLYFKRISTQADLNGYPVLYFNHI